MRVKEGSECVWLCFPWKVALPSRAEMHKRQRLLTIQNPHTGKTRRYDPARDHFKHTGWVGHIGQEEVTLIIDDTEAVWRGKENLILIEPYK